MPVSHGSLDTTMQMHRSDVSDLQLDPQRIIDTMAALRQRIDERFPGSGLGRLALRMLDIAEHSAEKVAWVARPILPLRIAIGIVIAALIVLTVGAGLALELPSGIPDFFELIQTLEAALNEVIILGLALFFLLTLENRIKRRRALRSLRELRAVAHIIDMHQLRKDPDQLSVVGMDNPSGPRSKLDRSGLSRYLDYCSEMLSLVSKMAALYAQSFDDPVVLSAVDEVESLTSGLSAKIWQKIMILDRMAIAPGRGQRSASPNA